MKVDRVQYFTYRKHRSLQFYILHDKISLALFNLKDNQSIQIHVYYLYIVNTVL